MKALKHIDDARVKYREYDCNEKLKKVKSQKINPSVEISYSMGDPVLFRDTKRKEWKQGTALVQFGKTLYLKFGNWLRRVPIDTVIPDSDMAEKMEDSFVEATSAEPDDEDRFLAEDLPVEELTKDLETAQLNAALQEKINILEEKVRGFEEQNSDEVKSVTEVGEKDATKLKRMERRKRQKMKKAEEKKSYPVLGQTIEFKENGSDKWEKARVFRVFKKSSIHKNVKQMTLADGSRIEKDFDTEIEEWKSMDDAEDSQAEDNKDEDNKEIKNYFLSSILNEKEVEVTEEVIDNVYRAEIINKKEYDSDEVRDAMEKEIQKYRNFEAFEEVDNDGQESVPVRWVVTRNEPDGKNQPIKARLCIRGDLEDGKDAVRSDSPSAGKETLKLALMISANEGFEVKGADIKSAYLQGQDLKRKIFVRPPPESGVVGKLWLLKKAAYGVLDGGRLFYLRLVDELRKLGLHRVHADGALFTYVKNGKFHGIVASVVDDLIIAGDSVFDKDVAEKLKSIFVFSKLEVGTFKYCGCNIRVKDNGDIELDQNDYVEKLQEIEDKEGDIDRILTSIEKKELRGKIGELLWVSLMTRPDLSFDINRISTEVPQATLQTMKVMNTIIRKAKGKKEVLTFSKLGNFSDLIVKVYTDASFSNQDDRIRSTEGRVVLIENPRTEKMSIVSWKTKKIPRVCRSVKTAETRALEDGIDEAVNTARIVSEVYSGEINLKNPKQLPVVAKIDNKSLWENLHNSRQCEEKLLRNTIAGLKELMELGIVSAVDWVPTDVQLADCMTKKGTDKKADWLLAVARTNRLVKI